jgi:hypothetical protein
LQDIEEGKPKKATLSNGLFVKSLVRPDFIPFARDATPTGLVSKTNVSKKTRLIVPPGA